MSIATQRSAPSARLLILRRLWLQPHHIHELAPFVEKYRFAPETVKQALSQMKRAGLVENIGRGRWALAEPGLRVLVDIRQRRRLAEARADVADLQKALLLLQQVRDR